MMKSLFYLTLVLSLSLPAMARNTKEFRLLDFSEFSKLSPATQDQYMEGLQEFFVANQAVEFSLASRSQLMEFVFPAAHAEGEITVGNSNLSRCFFAGFMIKKAAPGKKNTCSPVQNLCSKSELNQRAVPNSDDLCSHFKNPSLSKCPRKTGDSSGDSPLMGTKKIALCNPMLFGVEEDGGVICVKADAQASKNCRERATELNSNDIAKAKWRALLAKKSALFDQSTELVENECSLVRKYGSTQDPADQAMYKGLLEAKSEVSGHSKSGFKDFLRTCTTLILRAQEVRAHINSGVSKPLPKDGVR